MSLFHACSTNQRCTFGHTIAYSVIETRLFEELFDSRIEFRASDSEEFDASSECVLKTHSNEPVQKPCHISVHPFEHPAFLNGREYARLVDFLDDERHGKHNCGTNLLESNQKYACRRWFLKIYDLGTRIHRIKHTETQLIGVGHRKYGKPDILFVGFLCFAGYDYVAAQVLVAQHNSLGVAGSA